MSKFSKDLDSLLALHAKYRAMVEGFERYRAGGSCEGVYAELKAAERAYEKAHEKFIADYEGR